MHPYLTEGRPRVLAHRGASRVRPPGNSRAAIRRAVELGVDHIETDVQVTRDGQVVLFHDERLDDHTTGTGPLSALAWPAASQLELVANGHPTGETLLRLEEALGEWPELFWNIDVKTDDAVGPTIDILRRHRSKRRVCLASFDRRRLRRLRSELGSGWCTAYSRTEIAVARLAAWLRLPIPRFGDVVQAPVRHRRFTVIDRRLVDACRDRGVAVHAWTINDAREVERLDEIGVAAVITDDPVISPAAWRHASPEEPAPDEPKPNTSPKEFP